MDIFLLAVLLVSGISGARKGFILTVKSFLQWFLCIIAGILLCNPIKYLLKTHTGLEGFLYELTDTESINLRIQEFLPDAAAKWLEPAILSKEVEIEGAIVSMLLTVISFLLIIIFIKLAFFVLTILFSKEYHDGSTGFTDSTLGLVFGLARGLFYVLLIFVLFIPLFSMWSPDFGIRVSEAASDSFIADAFYNDNILLTVLETISGHGNSI